MFREISPDSLHDINDTIKHSKLTFTIGIVYIIYPILSHLIKWCQDKDELLYASISRTVNGQARDGDKNHGKIGVFSMENWWKLYPVSMKKLGFKMSQP